MVRIFCALIDITHKCAYSAHMPQIDHKHLVLCMSKAPMTPKQLSVAIKKSLTYTCDITSGRRTLKRNPELRKEIAAALGVPQHWIEHHDEVA